MSSTYHIHKLRLLPKNPDKAYTEEEQSTFEKHLLNIVDCICPEDERDMVEEGLDKTNIKKLYLHYGVDFHDIYSDVDYQMEEWSKLFTEHIIEIKVKPMDSKLGWTTRYVDGESQEVRDIVFTPAFSDKFKNIYGE